MKIFDTPGKDNTRETMALAFAAAKAKGIKNVVFATTTGWTPSQLPEEYKDFHVVCVGESWGCVDAGMNPMEEERMEEIRRMGIQLVFCPHAFTASGSRNGYSSAPAIMADTLRMFSQGTKVAVEIAAMATDCGALPYMEPCVSMGGTGVGVDTALVLRPSHCNSILDTKIDEVLCMPYIK